ncbi:unnamed protein product [Adineta ricciae]|uniref:Uncharacterized protein n=1 Tax=Adineta ricciae TaxID=249248 RepID=A0A815ZHL5_ADIRI|nr:unnamed protein product [Adineta ricciae]
MCTDLGTIQGVRGMHLLAIQWFNIVRRLDQQLIGLDDLFALNFYTASNPEDIFGNAYHTAFVTQSDLIMLHRDKIYHSTRHQYVPARDHRCVNYHTKYIFQVPSATHDRGL